MVFKSGDKEYVVAANIHGRILAFDTELKLVGDLNAGGQFGKALATWEDADKVRWVLAVKGNTVVSYKVKDDEGKLELKLGWTSREMVSPVPPIVVNGVVFALSAGSRSSSAVLYAIDGSTGKELWNSGSAISGYSTSGISAGGSKVYVGTEDGMLYAFGYLLNRE
jgi:outer membrane protein assembly factor BamB